MSSVNVHKGARVVGPYGAGTVAAVGDTARRARTATAVVYFDSGRREVVLARRLRRLP